MDSAAISRQIPKGADMNTPVAQSDRVAPLNTVQQGAARTSLSSDGARHMGQTDFATFLATLGHRGHGQTNALPTPALRPAPDSETRSARATPFEKISDLHEPHTVTGDLNRPGADDPTLHARRFLVSAQVDGHPAAAQYPAQPPDVADPLLSDAHALTAHMATQRPFTSAEAPQDTHKNEMPARAGAKQVPQSMPQDGSKPEADRLAERAKATQGGSNLNLKFDNVPAHLLPVARPPAPNTGDQSARTEIAATAPRPSAYPVADRIAAQRIETVSDGSSPEAGTTSRQIAQGGTVLPASAAPSRSGAEVFQPSPRTQTDLTARAQMSGNAGGPGTIAATAHQPQPTASIINGLQTIQTDTKTDAMTSFLGSSEISGLSRWDTGRMPSMEHTSGTLPRGDVAAHVARQLLAVTAPATNRPIEIALSPQELGRVRMGIASDDGRITIHILAERPDTLDLMRRHIDQLGQSFRSMGYDEVSFSFGQQTASSDDTGTSPQDQQAASPARTAVSENNPFPDAPTVIQLDPTATSGVDIRL